MPTEADQQLMQAAYKGNLNEVNEALAKGADVKARGQLGDTALNEAAEQGHFEVVERLLAAGSDIENLGGADKTPLMNAAFAGHADVVQLLLEKGARVSDDLLSSVQLKVNILEENAEAGMVRPEAAEAWKGFFNFLVAARLKQDLPEIVAGLSAADAEERQAALNRVEAAANHGVDISAAAPRLTELLADKDAETRSAASAALAMHAALSQDWDRLRELFTAGDQEIKTRAIPALVSAAREGLDVSPLLPALVDLLGESRLNLRHDAAVILGYAATNRIDVSSAIPQLIRLLANAEPEARKIAAWALYRIAKYVGDISAAVPALQTLLADENEDVRSMARANASKLGKCEA